MAVATAHARQLTAPAVEAFGLLKSAYVLDVQPSAFQHLEKHVHFFLALRHAEQQRAFRDEGEDWVIDRCLPLRETVVFFFVEKRQSKKQGLEHLRGMARVCKAVGMRSR